MAAETPELEILRVQPELENANKKLEETIDSYIDRRLELDEQWNNVANREIEMVKTIRSFEQVITNKYAISLSLKISRICNSLLFLQFAIENQEKRERARSRKEEAEAIHVVKDKEIEVARGKLDKMTIVEKSMEQHCNAYKFYEVLMLN